MAQPRTVTWAAAALALYCLFLAFILLNPSAALPSSSVSLLADVAEALGAPDWVLASGRIEFVANALIFAPVSMLGALVWRSTSWRDWTAYAFAASAGVELVQGLLLSDRSASFVDVVSNTLGALMGALATLLLQWWQRRRSVDEDRVAAD